MLHLIKQPRNIFEAFMLIEEKWVAVGLEGYWKAERERVIHSQDKRMRLCLNFVTFGPYLLYLLLTTPTYVISSATCD